MFRSPVCQRPISIRSTMNPADLGGGGFGDVVGRAEADGVQELAPGRPARFEGGDERVGPAGYELVRGPVAAAVDVAEEGVPVVIAEKTTDIPDLRGCAVPVAGLVA